VTETLTDEKIAEVRGTGMKAADILRMIGEMAILRQAPRLAQVAEVDVFLASDRASGMTATIANVTSGLIAG
jgi:enoyl-[acyl-carrier-protein] reductase (NADH)